MRVFEHSPANDGRALPRQRIARSLEALIALDRPEGLNISDMGGAYNRILRTSLQRGIIEYMPTAIRLFQTLHRLPYRCAMYRKGSPYPVTPFT